MKTATDLRDERLVAAVQRTLEQRAREAKAKATGLRLRTRRMKDRQGTIDRLFKLVREIECRLPALETTLQDVEAKGGDGTDLLREIQSLHFDMAAAREAMNELIRAQQADRAKLEAAC